MRTTATSRPHRSVRRLACLAAAVGLIVAGAIGFTTTSDSGAASNRSLEVGCDGVMVIANVRCELGVPTAFDTSTVGYERAPWCGNGPDVTVYGCAHDAADAGFDGAMKRSAGSSLSMPAR